jgi:hypothetical protein
MIIRVFRIKSFALGCRPATLTWYSRKSMWWFFTRKYKHIFTFRHDARYGGTMEYESKDFGKRCHEDGVWCVEHSDSVYQGVTVFFNGSTYQHQNWTQNCITDNYDFCVEYIDYVTIKTT